MLETSGRRFTKRFIQETVRMGESHILIGQLCCLFSRAGSHSYGWTPPTFEAAKLQNNFGTSKKHIHSV